MGASRMALAFDVLRFCCGARHSVAIVRTWRMDTRQVSLSRDPALPLPLSPSLSLSLSLPLSLSLSPLVSLSRPLSAFVCVCV